MNEEELKIKVEEYYLSEYGSLDHYDYVKKALKDAICKLKIDMIRYNSINIDYCEKAHSFMLHYYLPIYIEKLKQGHSKLWADRASWGACEKFKDQYLSKVYLEIKEIDELCAKNDLILHCKNNSYSDPVFLAYFEYLMNNEGGFNLEDSFEKAEEYEKAYNNSISNGKSILFASKLASLKAKLEYSDTYCEGYAYAFEEAYNLNKSENYCEVYANSFASMLANEFVDLDSAKNDYLYFYYLASVVGKMQAFEYINEIKVDKKFFDQYVILFEMKYRNIDLNPNIAEPIDQEVLQKTLTYLSN